MIGVEIGGGRFAIERFVRAGGMGAVYRAEDRETGAAVALKVLRGAAPPEDEARFEREALVLAGLTHPGIVRHVAHGVTAEGTPYLAMEWIEGEDLAERLRRGPLAVDEATALGLGVARALGAAHARGVVHRDLKPSNILLGGGSCAEVKIVDFGIAAFTGAYSDTMSGAVLGTPAYVAPERAKGDGDRDPRVDVFALGAILHECLTGKVLFEGAHLMAVLAKIVFEEAPRLRDLGHDVPAALDALIARLLAKDPAARPADGEAVAEAFAALAMDAPRPSRPSGWDRPSLTRAEQRVVCIVLARAPDGVAAAVRDETLPSSDMRVPRSAITAIEGHGGRALVLTDGTLVVTTGGAGLAVDQAARAAGCALALRAALPRWSITVATGRGEVGAERVVGDAIERAAATLGARLRRPDAAAIDLDDVTAGLLDLRFDVALGPLGLTLTGERDLAEAARTLLGRPTPFVGRDREMAAIEALFAECAAEPAARATLITGAAGVGKSRLRHEIVARLLLRGGAEIWMARGDPMRAGAPFGVIGQLVRRTARLVDGEPIEARRQKLLARVSRYVPAPERRRVAEFLGEMAGTPFPDEGRVQLRAARQDPRLLGDQMRRAWVDFVDGEARARPLVIVLEDLHWGDAPSAEHVDTALRLLADRPLFVIALARPEVRDHLPRLFRERPLDEIRLANLPRRACERIAREVLGADARPEIVAALWRRSSGNAFFLEELLRATREGRDGALPETMQAMVGSRIDALDAEARRTLRAASIFGEVFWRGGLTALLGAAGALERLVEREWIVRRPAAKFSGEEEYAFHHALVREAAYGMLTDEDRALGHRLAGAWLAAAGEADAMVLAEHFERGGAAAEAVGWYCAAIEQALEGNDLPAVIARVDRAAALGAGGEALGRLSLARAVAHNWRGEHAEAEPWAEQAIGALPPGSAPWCAAMEARIWAAGARGEGARVASLSDDLLSSARGAEAELLHVVALTRAVSWLSLTGQREQAAAIQRAIDPMLDRFGDAPAVQAAAAVARLYLVRPEDDPATQERLLAVAVARFEEAGDRRQACFQRTNLAGACNALGAYAEAEAIARAAAAEAERLGVTFAVRAAQSNLGPALSRRGASIEAIRVLRSALDGASESDDPFTTGVTRLYLAEALQRAGDLTTAEAEVRAALRVLGAFRSFQCLATAQLADVLLARGRAGEALARARVALTQLQSLGTIDEGEALVRVVHVEALVANGHEDAATAALAAARARLLASAARFTDEDQRRRFLHDIPENARTLALVARRLGS
ncbi:MAG: protein kinase [Minicystis sp.]